MNAPMRHLHKAPTGWIIVLALALGVVSISTAGLGADVPSPNASELPAEIRERPVLRSIYLFVGSHRSFVERLPCYCGCVKTGHKNLFDCFVSRSAQQRKPSWNAHGADCGICLSMAMDAQRLYKAHTDVARILAELDVRYNR